ncbi:MAG: insulinase family protein [Candidatus Aenigmarchaeota archaeon]|nr:insulinase family protein [Candidatus Aenigmarchaeota archaeon]
MVDKGVESGEKRAEGEAIGSEKAVSVATGKSGGESNDPGKDYEEFTLENGFRVAYQATPTKTISAKIRIHHGALNELPGQEGYLHFLEHVLGAGGTAKYTPLELKDQLGSFGFFNAHPELTKMTIPADIISGDLETYLDVMSEMLFRPSFDSAALEEERKRVLREISDHKSDPHYEDWEAFAKAFFGENSPQDYPVIGKEAVIESATVDGLKHFYGEGFSPNNMDLVLVGGLPSDTKERVQKYFDEFSRGPSRRMKLPRNPLPQSPKIIHSSAPDLINQANTLESSAELSMNIYAPTALDSDYYAFEVLAYVLGEPGLTSRLFKSLSREKGLAYGIGASYDAALSTGTLRIRGKVDSSKAEQAISAIFEEMQRLQDEEVSVSELAEAKRKVKYQAGKAEELNAWRASLISRDMDGYHNTAEILAGIEKVTAEDVQKAAQKYLPSDLAGNYALLLRDPLKDRKGQTIDEWVASYVKSVSGEPSVSEGI